MGWGGKEDQGVGQKGDDFGVLMRTALLTASDRQHKAEDEAVARNEMRVFYFAVSDTWRYHSASGGVG